MTFRRTSYDTTPCDGFQLHKTQSALKAAVAVGSVHFVSPDMLLVKDGDNYRDAIPSFSHPMEFNSPNADVKGHAATLAIDVRPFGSWSKIKNEFVVRNVGEIEFNLVRVRLNNVWLGESSSYLKNLSTLPVKVFSSWISESISRRFGLDPQEQKKLSILAAIFYHSNFTDEQKLDENARLRLSGALSRDLGISQTEILEIVDEHSVIGSTAEFCQMAASTASTVRLNDLSPGVLYAALGGSWFGSAGNYKETVAVAIEHPPTWLAILYTAGTDRSYRNTTISKLFERHGARGADQQFFSSLTKLINAHAPIEY